MKQVCSQGAYCVWRKWPREKVLEDTESGKMKTTWECEKMTVRLGQKTRSIRTNPRNLIQQENIIM